MNIEHFGLLSWLCEKPDATKTKNHAQDGGMLGATRDQHPAILPWFLVSDGVHPFASVTGTLPVTPSGRIAAGRLCRAWPCPASCSFASSAPKDRIGGSRTIMQKRAAYGRA